MECLLGSVLDGMHGSYRGWGGGCVDLDFVASIVQEERSVFEMGWRQTLGCCRTSVGTALFSGVFLTRGRNMMLVSTMADVLDGG